MSNKKQTRSDKGWDDWGGYMQTKIQKLQDQYMSEAPKLRSAIGNKTELFKGVSIHVNGFTNPPADELKRFMMIHGGSYHQYYNRSKTTHIIASNLANVKIKGLTNEKVVKADWITDSIKEGRLLPYQSYLLYNEQISQPKLSFKPLESSEVSNSSSNCSKPLHDVEEKSLQEIIGFKESEPTVNSETYNQKPASYSFASELFLENENPSETVTAIRSDDMILSDNIAMKLSSLSSDKMDIGYSFKYQNSANKSDELTEIINSKLPFELNRMSNKSETKQKNKNFIRNDFKSFETMNATHEGFLSEFYNNSRLHHISTMGAEFKEYINQRLLKNTRIFPGRDRLLSSYIAHPRICFDDEVSLLSFQKQKFSDKIIMHIDMDCFFVSVGLRDHPHLRGKPVAVTHSKGIGSTSYRNSSLYHLEKSYYEQMKSGPATLNLLDEDNLTSSDPLANSNLSLEGGKDLHQNKKSKDEEFISRSEIASCSYEARHLGIKNGMGLGEALKLCPDLITIPYNFEGYKEVAVILYDTVASYTLDIEAVSCDEMYVDCTEILKETGLDPIEFASILRLEILNKTGCTCSCGLGPNMLLARLATSKAKPNSQYFVSQNEATNFVSPLPVTKIPGVGWSLGSRLKNRDISICAELQRLSLHELQQEFGHKTGQMLYNSCRGLDTRTISAFHKRKSVSAEVNYGIRFTNGSEAVNFLNQLSHEVSRRLQSISMRGRNVTLKLKVRKKGAPMETSKFMGHGICDNVARSATLQKATDDANIIFNTVQNLLHAAHIPPSDMRGMGIQINNLESSNLNETSNRRTLFNFLKSATNKPCTITRSSDITDSEHEPLCETIDTTEVLVEPQLAICDRPDLILQSSAICLPPPSQLDPEVLAALPPDIQEQIRQEYEQIGWTIQTAPEPDPLANPQPGPSGINTKSVPPVSADSTDSSTNSPSASPKQLPKEEVVVQENYLTSVSQIDASFLEALPPNIQQEVLQECEKFTKEMQKEKPPPLKLLWSPQKLYSEECKSKSPIRNGQERFKKKHSPAKKKQDSLHTSPLKNFIISSEKKFQEDKTSQKSSSADIRANLCGVIELNDVKKLIQEWIDTCQNPIDDDVQMFSKYLISVIQEKNLEKVDLLLKFLYRQIKTNGSSTWKDAYDVVVQRTQKQMVAIYGSPLKLP